MNSRNKKLPAAPPVYRPQPAPKVLQTKSALLPRPPAVQPRRAPVAPPVYRPQPGPVVLQRKTVKPVAPVLAAKTPPSRSINPLNHFARQTIQRTIWRFSGGAWVNESASVEDTDTYPLPAAYCSEQKPAITPREHDKYDQQTGTYKVWADMLARSLERAGGPKRPRANATAKGKASPKKKGKTRPGAKRKKIPKNFGGPVFDEERVPTAFGYFNPKAKGGSPSGQGPHLLAHVTKRAVFDLAEGMGLGVETLLDTRLAPEPRKALGLMTKMLAERQQKPKPMALYRWYYAYKRAYQKAKEQKPGWKQGLKEALELHPLTTYRIGEVASKAELASKNESAVKGIGDVEKILAHRRRPGIAGGLETVDPGFAAENWKEGDQFRAAFVRSYGSLSIARPPSPCEYPAAAASPMREDDDEDGGADGDDDGDDNGGGGGGGGGSSSSGGGGGGGSRGSDSD